VAFLGRFTRYITTCPRQPIRLQSQVRKRDKPDGLLSFGLYTSRPLHYSTYHITFVCSAFILCVSLCFRQTLSALRYEANRFTKMWIGPCFSLFLSSLHSTGNDACSHLKYPFHIFQGLPRSRRPFGLNAESVSIFFFLPFSADCL
jgi:hypothetical protein